MSNSLVSILMTAYNRERYIAEAIESALASTYNDFELIIVDDGSRDHTVEICREYEAKDKRVKVYVNEKNLGQFQNRNYIAQLATGKYLKYLDSDDLLYPNGLEVLVRMMESFPDAGYGLCSLIQDDKRVYPFELLPREAYQYHFFYKPIFHKAPLSSIILKSAFEKVKGFEVKSVCGDYALWLRLSQTFPVVLMPDGVVWYRVHEEQEMEKARVNKVVAFEYQKVLDLFLEDEKCPLDKATSHSLINKSKQGQKKFLAKEFLKGNFKEANELYRLYRESPVTYFSR